MNNRLTQTFPWLIEPPFKEEVLYDSKTKVVYVGDYNKPKHTSYRALKTIGRYRVVPMGFNTCFRRELSASYVNLIFVVDTITHEVAMVTPFPDTKLDYVKELENNQ
jgi:hypothetical protein